MVVHLTFFGFNIDFIDGVNQYLKSLKAVFPLWVEKQCSSFRTMRTIRASVIFNRYRRPDKSSSYNMFLEDDDDKTSKDIETELKSDLDPKLESFICVIRNFDLNDSKSNCFTSSLNFKNSVEDSKTESSYLAIFNKSKKPLKQSSNKPDLLLYDINIIDHIVNNRKWFKDDYTFNKG